MNRLSNKGSGLAPSTLASARSRFITSRPLFQTRNAHASLATDKETDQSVTFWSLRFPIQQTSKDAMLFNGHLGRVLGCPINCPPLIAYGVDRNGIGYYVTERTSGKPLSRKRIDPEMISIVFTGMLEQIAALHSGGLASGTLCEESFLVDAALGVSFVALIPALQASEQEVKLKLSDSIHSCIAPEQRAGKNGGQAADVYALGALLYRMIAKRSLPATAGEHQHFEHLRTFGTTVFKTSPQLAWMQPVLEKSLRWRPDNRYANASDFLADLKKRRPASDSNFRRNARIFEAVLTEYLLSPTAKIISVSAIVIITMTLLYQRASSKLSLETQTTNTLPTSRALQQSSQRTDVRRVAALKAPTATKAPEKKSLWDYLAEDDEESSEEYDTSDLGDRIQFGRHDALSNTDTNYATTDETESSVAEESEANDKEPAVRTFRRFSRSTSKPEPKKRRDFVRRREVKPRRAVRGDTPLSSWLDSDSAVATVILYGSALAPKRTPWCASRTKKPRRRF